MPASQIRNRKAGLAGQGDDAEVQLGSDVNETSAARVKNGSYLYPRKGEIALPEPSLLNSIDLAWLAALFVAAALLRFVWISFPAEVVFDEVHFGKFAAYYLRREYFFDVHPPFAKMLNAAAGYLAGFDGKFEFENIADKYEEHNVPYVKMRILPAIFGSLVVPLVYAIMRETGHAPVFALLSSAFVLFDNAQVTQTRLILLDAPLIFFMTTSLYFYIKFYKQRYNPFSSQWWSYMIATGVSLALTMSCKMVGLFTFITIGTAVCVDLWNLLDIRRGLPIREFWAHFMARVVGLILIPAAVYMFWFWVHFAILIQSGTGDSFMSSKFQQTLVNSPMLLAAKEIHYFDTVAMRHRGTNVYLHSHPEHYPLKYDDGRISSQGQQVTGYPHNDTNNMWQIVPTIPIENNEPTEVLNRHVIRLRHVKTDSFLLAHDVASPLTATNEEFTTVAANDTETRYTDTLFELWLDGESDKSQKVWMSKSSKFRLIHQATRVCMFTHPEPLPEWGFQQQEINGNKNALDKNALWWVDDLEPDPEASDYEERIQPRPPRERQSMNFFLKFFELQAQMLAQNAHLTASHPYATGPLSWPMLANGISFWTSEDPQRQIFFIGNPVGWWSSALLVFVFVGVTFAKLALQRRGIASLALLTDKRLTNSIGFFAVAWAAHYLPSYLMNRQLFLHHYLPAHICASLLAGGVISFLTVERWDHPVSAPGPGLKRSAYIQSVRSAPSDKAAYVAATIVLFLIAMFVFLAPFTYGTTTTPSAVLARKLLPSWTLHHEK